MNRKLILTLNMLAGLMLVAGQASALELNVLNNCSLQQSISDFVHGQQRANEQCRAPKSKLEAAVLRTSATNSCLVDGWAVGLDSTFSCVVEPSAGGRSALDCFRPESLTAIDQYKMNYLKEYAEPVSTYLDGARSCRASNGDVAIAVATQLSLPLLSLSRLEVGYVVAFADNSGTLLHGFTSIDPAANDLADQALEVIYAFSSDKPFSDVRIDQAHAEKMRIVTIDDGRAMKSAMQEMQRAAPVPIAVEFISFDLTAGFRKAKSILSGGGQAQGLDKLADTVGEILDNRSFTPLSDDEFEAKLHVRSEVFATRLTEGRPYGLRRASDVDPDVEAFFRRSDQCSEDRGGSFAIVAKTPAGTDEAGQYGSVAIFLLAGGDCLHDDARGLRITVEELRRNVKRNVED
ncbi:hypothetical protein G6L94_31035 [Agrobacterium rhizogenes]|nr:hypothetical protein [Rhizobium rhizogenes]NTI98137.1 hypothetical protein [Rhizobium rhizogenes]NTJ60560.1 hypothetical protein [Rhizobium rhizogenes]